MSLLDLPPEILCMVLLQTSKRLGLRALFPIRATSRGLRDEVDQVLFFDSPVIAFRRSRCIAAIDGHTADFLFNKLHKPLDARRELPALVHKMTDFLCKSLNIAEKDERSCQWRLCVGLVRYVGAIFIRDLLVHPHKVHQAKLPAHGSSELMDRYKVLAAMLFGAPHLVDHLWGSLPRDGILFNDHCGETSTTPLVHAVTSGHAALFDSIIKYCRTISPDTAKSIFDMHKAFGLALERSRADFACDIASVSTPRILEFPTFCRWLALAIPLRNMDLFLLILRRSPGYAQRRHLDKALKVGTFEMVTALFEVFGIEDVNDTYWSARCGESFIEAACGAGNMEVIQGLIDAGADVLETALSFALKNNKWEAFIHLRNLGYPLPSMERWPRKCSRDMYKELCAMKVEDGVEKTLLPSYSTFKRMSWQALRKLEAEIDPFSDEE